MSELSESYFLSAGEVNAEGEMALPLLVSKIIDIATAHANALGIGNPAMEHLGRGWVLSRLAVEMTRYPRVNEKYTLTTWVEAWNRHFSVRNFMVSDAEGHPVGYASSIWMVLDTRTRENAGLAHLSPPADMLSDRPCPIARPGKHCVILPMEENQPSHADQLTPQGQSSQRQLLPRGQVRATAPAVRHTFGYVDLDFYRHVNTVRYVALLLNQYSLADMDRKYVHRFEMAFLREGRYAEPVELLRADLTEKTEGIESIERKERADAPKTAGESQTMFSVADAADGAPLVFASVVLRGRNRS